MSDPAAHPYIPNSALASLDELFAVIPERLRMTAPLDIDRLADALREVLA